MGEGRSATWSRQPPSRKSRRGSDKDRRETLLVVPDVARQAMWDEAARHGWSALVLLIVDYRLTPSQAVGVSLTDEGLVVAGFPRPLPVDPADRPVLDEFVERPRHLTNAASVRSTLGRLRRLVVARLAAHDPERSAWRCYLALGVRDLRRIGAEELAEAADYDEAVYRALMHDEAADPDDTLRWLTRRARRVLAGAMADVEASLDALIVSGTGDEQ